MYDQEGGTEEAERETRWQGNKGENTGTMDFQPPHDLGSEPLSLSSLVRGILAGPGSARGRGQPSSGLSQAQRSETVAARHPLSERRETDRFQGGKALPK